MDAATRKVRGGEHQTTVGARLVDAQLSANR